MDAYNANPTSMELAIQAFEKDASRKSAVILGDMMELGSEAEKEHQYILDYCLKTKLTQIHLIGSQFLKVKNQNGTVHKHKDLDTFKNHINSQTKLEFDKILIKGSRAMKLETLLPFFESKF